MRIDAHMHVAGRNAAVGWRGSWRDDRAVIDAADRLEIDRLCCSIPIQTPADRHTSEDVREVNDSLLHAMARFPGRILGFAYLTPGFGGEALAELDRCVLKHGMVGVKLYNQYKCWDGAALPIVERAIELGIPILHHGGYQTPVADRTPQPNRSHSRDFAKLAGMYPDAVLIEGHPIVGDWAWALKALRNAPNVYVDTSGSVADDGFVEMAVRELGARRVLFATDTFMEEGVGKVLGARITERQRARVFGENMSDILSRRR